MKRTLLLSIVVLLPGLACGGDDSAGGGEADPRCQSLCTIEEPEIEGAFDMCSQASASSCLAECAARIGEEEALCASCLLEEACFGTSCDESADGDFCDSSGTCTVSGREGSCTYPFGDDAAREDCLRQVSPRREVDCQTEYRPVTECAGLCGG